MTPRDIAIGAVFAGIIAVAAWRARALTRGGALAAFAVGTLTYASGQVAFTLVLLAFFVPSVALSRIGRARKRALVDVGKTGPRDAMQVLANGAVATACAVLFALTYDMRLAFAFAGAYAAASADTWATEIGTLARHRPRSIFTLRPIPTGLSGGITLPGTLAEIAGAVWIAVVVLAVIHDLDMGVPPNVYPAEVFPRFVLVTPAEAHWTAVRHLLAIPIGGVLGATLDSVLGGSLQELRRCDACDRRCETDPHVCGNPTRLVRGMRGFSNDVVNFAASLAGAGIAFMLA